MQGNEVTLVTVEERIVQRTAFLMAAEILSKVTADDVHAAQAGALARGVSLSRIADIDRATVGETLLRLTAQGKGPYASVME